MLVIATGEEEKPLPTLSSLATPPDPIWATCVDGAPCRRRIECVGDRAHACFPRDGLLRLRGEQ